MPARHDARPRRPFNAVAVLLAAAAVLAAPVARAQDVSSRSPAQAGAWAMQFRVAENFQLSTFRGGILSLKRHSSPKTAIRLGLSGSVNQSSNSQDLRELPDPPIPGLDSDRDNYSLSLDVQRLKYTNPTERLSFFWALGPSARFERSTREDTHPSNPEQVSTMRATAWALGAAGNFGVEWFATPRFGLHAEYGLQATYGWSDQTTRSENSTNQVEIDVDTRSWNVGGTGVLFGLSAYF